MAEPKKTATKKPDLVLKVDESQKAQEVSETQVEDIGKLIQVIDSEFEKAETASSAWRTNQNRWFRQRMGIRPKTATSPWRGASNQHLPLVDKEIRKMKPEYTASVWNSKPICTLSPVDESVYDLANQSSWHLDWLLRSRMNIYPTLIRLSDIMLQKGFSIGKTVYTKRYEPKTVVLNKAEEKKKLSKELIDQGDADIYENPEKIQKLVKLIAQTYSFDLQDEIDNKKVFSIIKEIYSEVDNVEFTVDVLTYDAPEIIPIDPEMIFVPADTITEFDLENAPWIIHRYPVSAKDMIDNATSEKWDAEVVVEILKKRGLKSNDEINAFIQKTEASTDKISQLNKTYKNQREGQGNPTTKDIFMIHEVCMWYDADGDGKPERHVLEYCTDLPTVQLRFIKYPYHMAMWPYFKVPFELTDGTHYSPRGIAEILNSLACALNEKHNMKNNRQFLATTPWMFYNTDQVHYKNMEMGAPGKPTGVKGNPSTAVHWTVAPNSDQSFQYDEQFIHKWAEDIAASTDMIQSNDSGTLGEARMNQSARISVRQQDIDLWNMALREGFKRVFSLWAQYGPQTVSTYSNESGKVQSMVKSSFMRNWAFNVNGKLGVSDPILQAQEALADLDRFNGDPYCDQYFLRKEYLERKDPLKAKFILLPKGKFEENQAAARQAAEAEHQRQLQEQIMLAQAGIKAGGSKPEQSPAPQAQAQNITRGSK